MLRYFKFSNYKSFKTETLLDLRAKNITEHKNQVARIGTERILKVSSIFGLNSAGKSNVYSAFKHMSLYVVNSLSFEERNGKKTFKTPFFTFDKKYSDIPTKFEVSFIHQFGTKKKVVRYRFSILNNKIYEETLEIRAISSKTYIEIFKRTKNKIKSDDRHFIAHINNLQNALSENVLVLSLGAKLNIDILSNIRLWFLNNHVINFGNELESLVREKNLPECLVDDTPDNEDKYKLVEYMSCFDANIEDFKVTEIPDSDDDSRRFYVDVIYKYKDGESINVPLADLSAGTRKMFSLFQYLLDTLEGGGVLFIDEINAKIHPYLHKFIIDFFDDSKRNTSQLIFTSHETWLLSEKIVRRDGFCFVEKNNFTSTLVALSECLDDNRKKIRKDANYLDFYLKYKSGCSIENNKIFN